MTTSLQPTTADTDIKDCLLNSHSFSVVAGAGSGKTTSLITALNFLRDEYGKELRRNNQRIVCITYTKRATAVIEERLGFDDLYQVSTIHSFLWTAVSRFTKDIRTALRDNIIPAKIAKYRAKDNGGNSKAALKARGQADALESEIELLTEVVKFNYQESQFSNFSKGQIGHDDVITLAASLISTKPILQRGLGFQYPYIFVDEAQDTFDEVIAALNSICANDGLPIVGYFGDPMQQIYDNGAGSFDGPDGFRKIDKEENFRSATSIVALTNRLRTDIQQEPAGKNALIDGSVILMLIQVEEPAAPRGRYTPEQMDDALEKFDLAIRAINWEDNKDAKQLFLVRQMIARRLGFSALQNLFTGPYASTSAEDQYKEGSHFLLKPLVSTLCPLMIAIKENNSRKTIDLLRDHTPAFDITGRNKERPLKEMLDSAVGLVAQLSERWENATIGEVLRFAQENNICSISDRLAENLVRDPRGQQYDASTDVEEKSDWLVDQFLAMPTHELLAYSRFVLDHTPLSTQHGSKGEEYEDVLVVFDDVEAGWSTYSFSKLFTPTVSGDGTDGQLTRSRKLAYVCFSRARVNLRIFLYCKNALAARTELLESGLFTDDQVMILD